MIALKCPNCGADITLDDTRDFGFCTYCGTKVLLDEYKKRVDGVPGIANLLLRAYDFLKQGNVEKAREYYNRVLDIDIHNNEAILGLSKIERIETNLKEEKKRLQEESIAESYKRDNDFDYRTAIEITNFLSVFYNRNSNSNCIEGLIKYSNEEYTLIPCTKANAHNYVPTQNGPIYKWGLLSGDINKISNYLNQLLNKSALKHDILFISYESMEEKSRKFLYGKKWEKTGRMTYDVWIKVWK